MTANIALKLQLWRDGEVAIGPGKADLLAAIEATGSISAAARTMEMSYRRAWLLVDVMNRSFRSPLVRSAIGGTRGGGAQLTDTGVKVLQQFRAMEAAAITAAREHMVSLLQELAPVDDHPPP